MSCEVSVHSTFDLNKAPLSHSSESLEGGCFGICHMEFVAERLRDGLAGSIIARSM